MSILNFIKDNLPVFLLIFVRASALFMVVPLFGARNVPNTVKIIFSFFVSIIIFPFVSANHPSVPTDALLYIVAIAKELIIGLTMGFVTNLMFDGMILAGQFIGLQMGFGQAMVFNPQAEQQVPLLSEVYFIFTMFIFFLINGHHWLVIAFQKSFDTVPVGAFVYHGILSQKILEMFAQIFLIALIIAAPICGVLIMLDLVMGVIARTMPQMNILVLGFSIKIFVGLISIIISLPFLFVFIREILGRLLTQLMRIFQAI